jgi:CRISPR system Cascade subunit CasE
MYMTRATVVEKHAATLLGKGEYGVHKAVWDLFADTPDRERDFLYRKSAGPAPAFTIVSQRLPLAGHPAWRLASKPYNPDLALGDRLAFSLRANPVRSVRGEDDKQSRHDVVMDLKTRQREAPARQSLPELMEEAGKAWLLARAPFWGAEVDPASLRVDGYCQWVFYKKERRVKFSTLDFEGALAVKDPERFLEVLYSGVGPAKAFGCGLLLVRRI